MNYSTFDWIELNGVWLSDIVSGTLQRLHHKELISSFFSNFHELTEFKFTFIAWVNVVDFKSKNFNLTKAYHCFHNDMLLNLSVVIDFKSKNFNLAKAYHCFHDILLALSVVLPSRLA